MDKVKGFFESLTLFQWLALIAFIFGTISVTNAFLSLKSRFRDWNGTRNQAAFKKRVEELQKQITTLEGYRKNPLTYFFRITRYIVLTIFMWSLSFAFFITAFALLQIPMEPWSLFLPLSILFSIASVFSIGMVTRETAFLDDPKVLALEVIKFVTKAAKKGLSSSEADALVTTFTKSEFFTDEQKTEFIDLIGKHYPQAISQVWSSLQKTGEKTKR